MAVRFDALVLRYSEDFGPRTQEYVIPITDNADPRVHVFLRWYQEMVSQELAGRELPIPLG